MTGFLAAPIWLAAPIALLAAGRRLDRLLGLNPISPLPGLGVLLILAGALLIGAALRERRRLRSCSGAPDPSKPPLPEGGPYWFIRHPLHAGCQLVLLGAAVFLRSAAGLAAAGPLALLLWTGSALLLEERALLRRFPKAYARYRANTGLLWPSLYAWTIMALLCYYRIFFGLRIYGTERIPRSGPFFLIGLHRTYMDPFLQSLGVPRKVHYLATSVLFRHVPFALFFAKLGCIPLVRSRPDLRSLSAMFKILDAGGVVGLFPEGGRSWYGETACDPAVFKLLDKRRVPIVTAELIGGFEYYPRYARRVQRHPLRLEYRVYPAGGHPAQRLIQAMMRREHRRDAELRSKGWIQQARGAEQLAYVCPRCRTPFRTSGSPNGTVRCGACRTRFRLLRGKGLAAPGEAPLSLPDLERLCLQWSRRFEPHGLSIPGRLLLRCTRKAAVDLQADHRLRRRDLRDLRAGRMVLQPKHLEVRFEDGGDQILAFEELTAVLVEGNQKLELSYRSAGGEHGFLLFIAPQRYALFLQHLLRWKAFGNPQARYRGSRREELADP